MATNKIFNSLVLPLIVSVIAVCSGHYGGLSYIPHVGNVAIGRHITASSTCGIEYPEQYCPQESNGDNCMLCDDSNEQSSHPPHSMIDYGDSFLDTWWQSMNGQSAVTININMNKSFSYSHVIISFKSLRPAAMSISKSSDYGHTYQLLQRYSNDCQRDFGSNRRCIHDYSHPSPGEMIYIARHSDARNNSLTNLRIKLQRFNMLFPANSNMSVSSVRLFYAIYNIDVFGWCFCNGHEYDCKLSNEESSTLGMVPSVCQCGGNTTGIECEQCLSNYNDSPWTSGFDVVTKACQECNCNNRSDKCTYDNDKGKGICRDCMDNFDGDHCEYCTDGYYTDSGSCKACQCNTAGSAANTTTCLNNGSCICKVNVAGQSCDQCRDGHYNLTSDNPDGCQACSCDSCEMHTGRCPCHSEDVGCCNFDEYLDDASSSCVSCDCHVMGSHGVCHDNGTCVCKPGVGGAKCDTCLPGYYSLSGDGCLPCHCNVFGSHEPSTCDNVTGQCPCFPSVRGRQCERCPDGSLGPVRDGAIPCISCFCNGYSDQCRSEDGWYWTEAESSFNDITTDDWISVNNNAELINNKLIIHSNGSDKSVISFPPSYIGDKRTSYGLYLDMNVFMPHYHGNSMTMKLIGMPSRYPIMLKVNGNLDTTNSSHKIPLIASTFNQLRFFFVESATENTVRKVLAKLQSIELSVEYGPDVPVNDRYVNITYVKLPYATTDTSQIKTKLISAPVGESCQCPMERGGPRCNYCSRDYSLDPPSPGGNEFDACVRCTCNNLADTCDPFTNECINCRNGTTGTHCQLCIDGYYRNGTECFPCECPGGSNSPNQFAQTCKLVQGNVVCHCQDGYHGKRCDTCEPGYHGNPTYPNGRCQMCKCNNNSDADGSNICHNVTGDCLCGEGYAGLNCGFCQLGFYGNATFHDCQRCTCNVNGTIEGTYCNQMTGQCSCRDNVEGNDCTQCKDGFWGDVGSCLRCECNGIGSASIDDCDTITGQCDCQTGYTGLTCSDCIDGYWNDNGTCISCDCSISTSLSVTCNKSSGACTCKEGVTGRTCDQCTDDGNGLFPSCQRCSHCSMDWIRPINGLAAMADNVSRIGNITHTEIDKGLEAVEPITELLMEIHETSNISDGGELMKNIFQTYIDINNCIEVIRNLINRANEIRNLVERLNQTHLSQFTQLDNITGQLIMLEYLLSNVTSQHIDTTSIDFTSYIKRIQNAVISSNETLNASHIVSSILNESQIQLDTYTMKEGQFLNESNRVIELLIILREKLRIYQSLIIRADEKLCGSLVNDTASSCDCNTNEKRCHDNSKCGGIGCDTCGGKRCNGSVSIIDRAANVTMQALEEAERFRASLQDSIIELQEANVTSSNALSMAIHVENLSEELLQNISNLMETVNSSIGIVLSLNRTDLPNINILYQLTNQTLSIAISKTYHEIRDVLTDINTTIDSFPSIEFDGTLRMRAEKALNDSLLANVTATIVMRNIMELRELLVNLESQGTLLEKRTNDNQRDLTNIQRIINEVKVRVNLVQTTLHRLSVKISNFNTTIREIRNLFDTNVQNLNNTRNLSELLTMRIGKLHEDVTEKEMKSSDIKNTTLRILMRAENDLENVRMIHEKMLNLKRKTHDQLLNSRNIQNRKKCLVDRQEMIRDDIKRIATELELIHNDIETEITRNTICMKQNIVEKK